MRKMNKKELEERLEAKEWMKQLLIDCYETRIKEELEELKEDIDNNYAKYK
jgi:hypothetical protein